MRLNSCQIWVSLASGDRRQEEGAGQREAHGSVVKTAPGLHWCLSPQQGMSPSLCPLPFTQNGRSSTLFLGHVQ